MDKPTTVNLNECPDEDSDNSAGVILPSPSPSHSSVAPPMAKAKLSTFIKQIPVFDSLNSKQCQAFEECAQYRKYIDGEIIIRQGDTTSKEFYIVMEGKLVGTRVIPSDEGHVRLEMINFGVGDHFGELALINNSPRAATVISQGECCLAVITNTQFEDLFTSLKGKLQQTASMRYSVQHQLEKNIPRHRSFMHKPSFFQQKHPQPFCYIIPLSELPPYLVPLNKGPWSSKSRSGSLTNPVELMPKTVTLHLLDKRGFHSCARLAIDNQLKLDNILSRERASGLGESDESGRIVDRASPVITGFHHLSHGAHYCLLFNPRPPSDSPTAAAAASTTTVQ